MTLYTLIDTIKEIALRHPNVRTSEEGSIYTIMNTNPSIDYDCVILSQTTHTSDSENYHFGFNVFYVSRLVDNLEANRRQIQSIAIEILNNIFRLLEEEYEFEVLVRNITPFTQKFVDETAGQFANIEVIVPKDYCPEEY